MNESLWDKTFDSNDLETGANPPAKKISPPPLLFLRRMYVLRLLCQPLCLHLICVARKPLRCIVLRGIRVHVQKIDDKLYAKFSSDVPHKEPPKP